MTTLFFLLSLLFGWMSWNLYHPSFENPRTAFASFAFGLPTSELAPHVIFWQVMTVAFFVLIGAVWGFFGAIGFLICVSAWAGMAYHYYLGAKARQEMSAGLKAGLGEDYEAEIQTAFEPRSAWQPDRELLRHPFRHHDPDVELIRNLRFGDHGQKLDLRRPRQINADQPMPVLLQIHGGAWTYGRKHDGQGVPLMNYMAKQGWICIASSYRLSPDATFPDHIIDCKQALAWIREHIAEYGGDPNFVAVTGGSAGGHLSSLLALTSGYENFQPGFESADTSVQAAVPFYGVFDFTDEHGLHHHDGLFELLEDSILKLDTAGNEAAYREASPTTHISAEAPPMLIIQGDMDTLVPVATARKFVDEMRETSDSPVAYVELSGAQHAFDVFPSIRSEYVKFGVSHFLNWTYSNYLRRA